jgi:glutamyl-tRNA reductase
MDRFHIVGITYNTSRFESFAEVALSAVQAEALAVTLAGAGILEPVVIATCNRLEVVHAGDAPALDAILDAISLVKGVARPRADRFFSLSGIRALEHLMRVVSGLDSLVLGEPEIIGQVKAAFRRSDDLGLLESHATRLAFDSAYRAAKRVRSETSIGRGHFSVAVTAIRVLENRLGDLCGRRVLVVGAGKTGELAARHFRDRTGCTLTLANRTRARAEALALEIGKSAVIDLTEVPGALGGFDVVVLAIEGDEPFLRREHLRALGGQGIHLVDLSMPAAVEAGVIEVPGVTLIDIASLDNIVTTHASRRSAAVPEAEAIIVSSLDGLELKLWEDDELKPVIHRMNSKISAVLGEIFPQLAEHVVEQGARRLVHMHVRHIKGIRGSVEERQARLDAMVGIYVGDARTPRGHG